MCDCALEIGDWPFHPHGRPSGMLGSFQERTVNLGSGPRTYTSLAELRRDERKAGLEPIERHEMDRIPSRQEQARKALQERQRVTEPQRLRAIGEALRQSRRG
jgi:hypothetical protein